MTLLPSNGVLLNGTLDAVEAAAMWADVKVTENQSEVILKYLRTVLGGKITVPISNIRKFRKGFTKPQAGYCMLILSTRKENQKKNPVSIPEYYRQVCPLYRTAVK